MSFKYILFDDIVINRDELLIERKDSQPIYNIINNLIQDQKEETSMSTYQFGSGNNYGGDHVEGDKVSTQFNNSPNLAQAAKDIKELLDQLSQEYSNNGIVGAKAIEEIEKSPTLKARFVAALKEAGSTAFEKAVDHPAVSIVIAAMKGFIDG